MERAEKDERELLRCIDIKLGVLLALFRVAFKLPREIRNDKNGFHKNPDRKPIEAIRNGAGK